tara:strand:- start:130 stop:1077 length:948 start_codon:yes stop_codon:yes gene_type:complete
MAHYAYISNAEFTITERARLFEVEQEINSICQNNIDTEGYKILNETLETKYTSDTLETLQAEALNLETYSDDWFTKQEEIQAEELNLKNQRLEIIDQLHELEYNNTEDLIAEKETLETTISNALCRVTNVIVGKDEIYYTDGDSSEIDAEILALEESRRGKSEEEVEPINEQIQNKIQEKQSIPKIEVDNTVYLEAVYGGAKRTSYNNNIRKNFAGEGMIYDPVRDAFYEEQPYESWTLDEDTCVWQPPTPKPGDKYFWKDDTTEWVDYVYFNPDKNQPYPSWTWNTETGVWQPPVEKPIGPFYKWDEETQTWII